MAKRKTAPPDPQLHEPEEREDVENIAEDDETEFEDEPRRLAWRWRLVVGLPLLAILLVGSFELAYRGRIYPGVSANGVYLGGQSPAGAETRLAEKATDFAGHAIAVTSGDTTLRIPVNSLSVQYQTKRSAELAYQYGRQGNLWRRLHEQARAILGRPTEFAVFTYADDKLTPYVSEFSEDIASPVLDASLTFNDDKAQVSAAQNGRRLDLGRLALLIQDRLAHSDTTPIPAPVYALPPAISTAALEQVASQADAYIAGPITLNYGQTSKEIDRTTIVEWLKITHRPTRDFLTTRDLLDLYSGPAVATLSLSRPAVQAYVAELARNLDLEPQNATLSIQDGQVAVAQASRAGAKLDQVNALEDITKALTQPADDRTVELDLAVIQPEVNETNLPDLGIKELISEGVSLFPGSAPERIQNVRVGAARYNGVILKPDQVFSFGALLGDVGPETGYAPARVIIANRQELQYGGGLCQVSSTAFRAALLAGLPILERHNHSFAVSYYTAPYGVPGVDATIYYPQVDFKFKNDTGHYLLIQTIMQGTTLKFQFYGTKTKTGVIRGPQFVSGSADATQPSHTVFYRDVLDLGGAVTKTDTFHTRYKSSNDFPVQQQFN